MQVFANLCEPHSFMRSIMKSGETYSIAACNFFEGLSLNTSLLKSAFPNNPITVPVTGHSLFAKIYIDYTSMHISYRLSGDYRKFFEIFNLAGKLLFSIGYKANPYGITNLQPLGLYSWNADGSLKNAKYDTTGLYPLGLYDPTARDRYPGRAISYHYYNDPNDIANSKFDIYFGGELILSMSGGEFGSHTDYDPATTYFFRSVLELGGSYRHRLGYLVVTDTLDLSLEPVVIKPLALTYSADFSGTIDAIKENFQDESYLSCSAEAGKYIEFTLDLGAMNFNRLSINGDLLSGSMFFYSRYLQIGGTSVTFTISLYNGVDLYYSEDVVLNANEDSAYYQTKLLGAIGTAVSGLKALQFRAFKVRISLKEV